MANPTPELDGEPFPEPYPQSTGFGPMDSDDAKEWRKAKAKWEKEHGPPRPLRPLPV
ncbi:hypothetical protein SAMN05660748_4502 [Blastococcus aggregatus]|uniref:Uncharacterized protein n=1 Tax=Blastococcus aggregatus TaxID=38502 RepID=A0A285VI69_9ACTN|nr:hypothetical protein [Blastococcus aggregatus]SOC53577.1 hypothetical protein SAMN05660748_4502 [Blastococcus aggregatus]